jgi:hypothetical protein
MCDDCSDELTQVNLIAQSKRVDPDELWQMGEEDDTGGFSPYDATGWQVEARWFRDQPYGLDAAPLEVWSTANGKIAWYTEPGNGLNQAHAAFRFAYTDPDFGALYGQTPGWLSLVVIYPSGQREVYAELAVGLT